MTTSPVTSSVRRYASAAAAAARATARGWLPRDRQRHPDGLPASTPGFSGENIGALDSADLHAAVHHQSTTFSRPTTVPTHRSSVRDRRRRGAGWPTPCWLRSCPCGRGGTARRGRGGTPGRLLPGKPHRHSADPVTDPRTAKPACVGPPASAWSSRRPRSKNRRPCRIPLRRDEHVDDLAELVDGAVDIPPAPGDFHIRLICLPTVADDVAAGPGCVSQQRREALHPAVDGDVGDFDAAFGE